MLATSSGKAEVGRGSWLRLTSYTFDGIIARFPALGAQFLVEERLNGPYSRH